ncbi:hypothetical protein Bca52824_066225 [Brassica carinata]|uniref:Uncharacterized protein n=1 Tax=Brassica carinata TaxID=52824 RepID=A0A8X7QJU7_BRACI|nr:hypothetical protein Bca52824_066225 [Brassica carinata]
MAWWDADSDFLPNFGKITFMVILSEIEPSFLVFLEGLRKAGYKVRLAVPDADTSLSSSPKLLDNTVRFESLYKSLLQEDMMTMTREVVVPPMFYPPIQTTPPPLCYPPIQTTPPPSPPIQIYSPGVFLDLPESLLLACDPYCFNFYIRTSLCFDDDFSIMAYVVDTETSSFPEGLVDAFTSLGITIIPQQAEIGARAHKMSLDIVLWALDNTATYLQPRDLLVFSGNVKEGTDFYNALEALRDRYYNVRVAPHLETCWPHPHHQMSLDHWPKEVVFGFSHGVASLCKQNLKVCGVFVFWDVQGCPTDLSVILQVLLIPYLDMDYQGDELFTYDGYACVPSIKVQGE